jgi:cytochrome c553
LEGVSLPELKPLPVKAAASKPAPGKGVKGAKGSAAGVSFVKDVAPILNTRCGGCHVRNARGQFSMATYNALMKGPPAGKVIFGGNVDGSELILKVQDKEMPPNGAGIPDAELATLKQWVAEGAKFDGRDPEAQLVSYVPAGNRPAQSPLATVQSATGKETISFAKDIAPVLVANCTGCHGGDNPRGNLNMTDIAAMFRGGDRGEPLLPGRPNDSLIIKKLRGTADGERMPRGRPPLDDVTIGKFAKWIEEGARFDGLAPNQPLAEVVAYVKALEANHEELSADRARLADANWRLGMPGTTAKRAESTNFLVLGSVGENTLAEIAQKAEALAPRVAEDKPLVKGRMTLFVFGERYDYGEFGKMVERRDLPATWRGHYRFTIIDAYGAVLVPKTDDFSLDALIAQQLAAVYIASLGQKIPHWFAEGCGRVAATRIVSADNRIAAWNDELAAALAAMKAPDDFLNNKLSPEQADVCSFSFVKFLMSDPRRFQILLDALRKGGNFGQAFRNAYGSDPEKVAAAWWRNPPKASGRAKR